MAIIKSKKRLPGIHPAYRKHTMETATAVLPVPAAVMIPMLQHIGPEAVPTVRPGERVLVGQKLGDSDSPMGVPVHASVSGTVKQLGSILTSGGKTVKTVIIEADGQQEPFSEPVPVRADSREAFLRAVRESGLVGLGGAGFPTHVKLGYRDAARVDTLIVNGAECEPYITSDYRECIEHPSDIAEGIKLVMHHLGLTRCIIGIERNKPDAIALLSRQTEQMGGVSVMPLKSIYPQGAEKVLLYCATGKILEEGQLPADCGAVVLNISTVAELARYFRTGMPLVSRRLTVDGDAAGRPGNVMVPVGTPIRAVLEFCNTDPERCREILMGGPMMGIAVADPEMPVVKNNNAVLAFSRPQASYSRTSACIRCGKCVRACPVGLMPAALERAYDNRALPMLRKMKVNLCINCGCCSYVCPAKRDLAAKNQLAKQLIREK